MCIFHVSSNQHSFKDFLVANADLPVYQQHEKGEKISNTSDGSVYEDFGFSCEVSDREWDDVDGQIVDMVSFLEVYAPYLKKLQTTHQIDDWRFDLPYECRLDENVFTQIEYLPPKLLLLAGQLGIGIELSQYWAGVEYEEEE